MQLLSERVANESCNGINRERQRSFGALGISVCLSLGRAI